MAFNDNWNHVHPRRTVWSNSANRCIDEGAVYWGQGAARTTKDNAKSIGVCGRDEWHSGNNASGNGNAVKEIQKRLNKARNEAAKRGQAIFSPALTVDGVFGSATTAAAKWFQNRAGVTADGLVGLQTRNRLKLD